MDLRGEYRVELNSIQDNVRDAQSAVAVHRLDDYPDNRLCRSCRGWWPCQTRRWGVSVLAAAGWTEHQVADLVHRAQAGQRRWS